MSRGRSVKYDLYNEINWQFAHHTFFYRGNIYRLLFWGMRIWRNTHIFWFFWMFIFLKMGFSYLKIAHLWMKSKSFLGLLILKNQNIGRHQRFLGEKFIFFPSFWQGKNEKGGRKVGYRFRNTFGDANEKKHEIRSKRSLSDEVEFLSSCLNI